MDTYVKIATEISEALRLSTVATNLNEIVVLARSIAAAFERLDPKFDRSEFLEISNVERS